MKRARLADLPDVLTIRDVCRVLRMAPSTYYELKAHRAFPIQPLKGVSGVKYAKVAVERHLARSA